MKSNVEPEEVEAILALVGKGRPRGEVAERDFSQPRRMSAERLVELRRLLQGSVPAIDAHLASVLRESPGVELGGVREISSDGLFAEPAVPLAMARFRIDGQPGWIVWQIAPAIAAIERVLGSSESSGESRRLSRVERRILAQVLEGVVRTLCQPLSVVPEDFRTVADVEEIGTWHECAGGGDPYRLEVGVGCGRGEGESTFHVYLPGLGAAGADALDAARPASTLPRHLFDVPLVVGARLGSVEVRLSDLLALEEGDVIPLGIGVGEPLRLCVEDLACATARMGQSRGQLAVRVQEIHPAEAED